MPPEEVQNPEAEIAGTTDQPETAGDSGVADEATAVPSISDLLNEESADEAFQSPAIQKRVQEQVRRAEQRSKDRTLADQRRRFNDPAVVKQEMNNILQAAGVEASLLDEATLDRGAQNLSAAIGQASADKIAAEIPGAFLGNYKYTEDMLSEYHEHLAGGRPDEAFQVLIDGAVVAKGNVLETAFEDRVQDAAKKQAQAELNAASGNGTTSIPATTKGNSSPNTGASLTTAELQQLSSNAWTKLSEDTKATIYANVAGADAERGSDTVDATRIAEVAALAQ